MKKRDGRSIHIALSVDIDRHSDRALELEYLDMFREQAGITLKVMAMRGDGRPLAELDAEAHEQAERATRKEEHLFGSHELLVEGLRREIAELEKQLASKEGTIRALQSEARAQERDLQACGEAYGELAAALWGDAPGAPEAGLDMGDSEHWAKLWRRAREVMGLYRATRDELAARPKGVPFAALETLADEMEEPNGADAEADATWVAAAEMVRQLVDRHMTKDARPTDLSAARAEIDKLRTENEELAKLAHGRGEEVRGRGKDLLAYEAGFAGLINMLWAEDEAGRPDADDDRSIQDQMDLVVGRVCDRIAEASNEISRVEQLTREATAKLAEARRAAEHAEDELDTGRAAKALSSAESLASECLTLGEKALSGAGA